MRTKKNKLPEDQTRAFRKAARELGCDDNEERFQEALRTLAKTKPLPEKRLKRRSVRSRAD